VAVPLLFSACGTEPVVTTITLNTASIFLDALGATFQLTASLTDQNGKPITDQSATWSSSDEQVATVSTAGLVTAVSNGTATIQATAGGVTASATVTVAQEVASIQVFAGDGQTGEVGATLPTDIAVQVNDALSNPIVGVNVAFAVTAGGGSVAVATVATAADGRAATAGKPGYWALATATPSVHERRRVGLSVSVGWWDFEELAPRRRPPYDQGPIARVGGDPYTCRNPATTRAGFGVREGRAVQLEGRAALPPA